MVFIAFNYKNEIIFANNTNKGKYKCVFCNDNIFYIKKSIDNKIEHFRHKIKCKYAENINKNINFYTNDFHFKWTRNLVKPEYLYQYWNNTDIADVINKNKIRIIIRRQLLKQEYHVNDDNIIWILDGDLRKGIIKKIIYEYNEIKYYFCNNGLYDFKYISLKHKIYIDYGVNQIIEISAYTENNNYCLCNIINIDEFIKMYFDGITYNPIKYIGNNIEIQELYGYTLLDNKVEEYNNKINNEIKQNEDIYKENIKFLKNYCDNYNKLNNLNQIKYKILEDFVLHKIYFLYDDKYNINNYNFLVLEYYNYLNLEYNKKIKNKKNFKIKDFKIKNYDINNKILNINKLNEEYNNEILKLDEQYNNEIIKLDEQYNNEIKLDEQYNNEIIKLDEQNKNYNNEIIKFDKQRKEYNNEIYKLDENHINNINIINNNIIKLLKNNSNIKDFDNIYDKVLNIINIYIKYKCHECLNLDINCHICKVYNYHLSHKLKCNKLNCILCNNEINIFINKYPHFIKYNYYSDIIDYINNKIDYNYLLKNNIIIEKLILDNDKIRYNKLYSKLNIEVNENENKNKILDLNYNININKNKILELNNKINENNNNKTLFFNNKSQILKLFNENKNKILKLNNQKVLELKSKINENENKIFKLNNKKINKYISNDDINIFYIKYCNISNTTYTSNFKNKKLLNKLDFTHNIKCINCNTLLEILSNNILLNEIHINKYNICKNCKIIYDNNTCELCDNKLNNNFNYEKLKIYQPHLRQHEPLDRNNKYYHLKCYNDNINCKICNLETDNFEMHDLCYQVNEILNIKCLECNKNILNNSNLKYIDENQLNEIINNYNNNFINNYNIHIKCFNIKYLIKIIADNEINIITKNIFNKI